MSVIRIASFDPALSNLGIALMEFDTVTGNLTLKDLRLIQTEGTKVKQVRKNSDDLQRAGTLYAGMMDACNGMHVAIAEIPTGTQSSRGAMSNGIVIGVLAACPLPLVEVTPTEAKMAGPGIKTATKQEMIDWGVAKYPDAPWLTRRRKNVLTPILDNEHLADAVAIAHAGVKTPMFRQAIAMMGAMSAK